MEILFTLFWVCYIACHVFGHLFKYQTELWLCLVPRTTCLGKIDNFIHYSKY